MRSVAASGDDDEQEPHQHGRHDLSYQRLWDRAVVQERSETIGLLLKDFEEGASDWLWETDAAGQLSSSRRRFAACSTGTPRTLARRVEAEALASRAVAEIGRPFRIDEARLEIGVSVGIAYGPDDAIDPSSLVVRADLALYGAKAEGKGCWRTFDPALEQNVQRHRQLDLDMRAAVAADEMDLHDQPLVDLRSGRVAGFEALLRWNKPGQGWVSPSEVIPVAEGTGFIVEIGRWALRRARTDGPRMGRAPGPRHRARRQGACLRSAAGHPTKRGSTRKPPHPVAFAFSTPLQGESAWWRKRLTTGRTRGSWGSLASDSVAQLDRAAAF